MRFFADLHIHSRYSRATSSRLLPEVLDRWARVKGLAVLGTGDFTHPAWIQELKEKLIPAEEGLYILSPEVRREAGRNPAIQEIPLPANVDGWELPDHTRFLLSAEISTIYSAGGKVRKVHHVILAPSFKAVDRIREALGRLGNLASDGRPILGLDSRDLLEIMLEADPACVLIPAHIWTPWFSVLGSKSGFDSIEEAYRDLSDHVFALETGLSSDPPMNWLCSSLDSYAIVSNSDAHSPEHLGREANRFDAELSYAAMMSALREAAGRLSRGKKDCELFSDSGADGPQTRGPDSLQRKPVIEKETHGSIGVKHSKDAANHTMGENEGAPSGFLGTVEFFPQEGKYHFDGHRKCNVVMNPVETARKGGICPVCGKPLTVGVMNRVIALADRMNLEDRPRRSPFVSLIPLREILSELLGVGPGSRAVENQYGELISSVGPELWILSEAPLDRITRAGGELLAEGIRRMRERRVYVEEGYDGEYGRIRVFSPAGFKGFSVATRSSSMGPGAKGLFLPSLEGESLFPGAEGVESKKDKTLTVDAEQTEEREGAKDTGLRKDAASTAATGQTDNTERAEVPGQTEKGPLPRGLLDFDIRELEALKAAAATRKEAGAKSSHEAGRGFFAAATTRKGAGDKGKEAVGKVGRPDALFDSFSYLNPDQRKAVEHGDGPLLILAGPGTGKTSTLTHRIAYLVKQGVEPERILALTFTNKAAEEMRLRLERILGNFAENKNLDHREADFETATSSGSIWIGTFHSFGLSILREFHHRFGRTEDFLLLWEEDQRRILGNLSIKAANERAPSVSRHDSASRYDPASRFDLTSRYSEAKEKLNAFDLDDLLDLPVNLLEKDSEVRAEIKRRYTHIFVDEYQDVNEMQYRLLRLLAPEEKANLTVIGDPNQAIYGFRGADVRFIEQFTTDYPHATVISLSKSYRCPEAVLKASLQVMQYSDGLKDRRKEQKQQKQRKQQKQPLISGIPGSVKIRVSAHPGDASEAEFVARTIEALTGGMRFFSMDSGAGERSGVTDNSIEGLDLGEIAVLCRTSHQMEKLQKAFHDHAIPYVRIGERSSLREEPAASLLDLARFLTSPQNPYLRDLAAERLPELYRQKLSSYTGTPEELLSRVESPLQARECQTRLMEVMECKISIPPWPDEPLTGFLRRIGLRTAQDDLPYRLSRVTLSTIHGVKGLEFDCVFLTGCEEGLLPYTLFPPTRGTGTAPSMNTPSSRPLPTSRRNRPDDACSLSTELPSNRPLAATEPGSIGEETKFRDTGRVNSAPRDALEEERRLFYVGMTRAKKYLFLTRAKRRFLFGREYRLEPSSFLKAIEEELLERVEGQGKKRPRDSQLSLF